MVPLCDVVTINAPLHPETLNLFNDALIGKMKRGAYLVDTARALICDRDAVVRALESGQLAGYAGDVWFPQPAPKDHPWRTMPHHGMTPHISGSSLSAQARYAAGTREILECWFEGRPIREEYLIVDGGKLAGAGAHSYSVGKQEEVVFCRPAGPGGLPEPSIFGRGFFRGGTLDSAAISALPHVSISVRVHNIHDPRHKEVKMEFASCNNQGPEMV